MSALGVSRRTYIKFTDQCCLPYPLRGTTGFEIVAALLALGAGRGEAAQAALLGASLPFCVQFSEPAKSASA